MQRKDYSKLGLWSFQNNERSTHMFAECREVHLSFLPFAKLGTKDWATKWENRSVDSDCIRDNVVSKAKKLRPGQPTNRGSITGKGKILTLFQNVQTDFGDHQAAFWWPPGRYPRGKAAGVWTTHHHLVAMLRMNGAKLPPPHLSLWRVQKLYIWFSTSNLYLKSFKA
jgi:hypothetical protein